ncbi:cyclin-domain-containing protein [Sporodiniella umbellata]|nr:cyclin-domain-containing protein [Sporodiniella umbellata]
MNIKLYPTQHLIKIVSELLESILQSNSLIPDLNITHFHSRSIPGISIFSYLSRIHKFAPFDNEVLISVLVYFDRITNLNQGLHINAYSVHRLLIASILIASKFTSDTFYSNRRYAKVGGVSLQELNQLELQFLFSVGFQLRITLEDLQEYADQLLLHANTPREPQPNEKRQIAHIQSNKKSTLPPLTPYSSKVKRHRPYKKPCQKSDFRCRLTNV